MAEPSSSRSSSSGAIALLALVLVGIAVFYFGVYDTAAARCTRGDLGACVVALAQQQGPPAPDPTPTPSPTPTPVPSPTPSSVVPYDSFLDDVAAGLVAYESWCPATGRLYVHGAIKPGAFDYFVLDITDLGRVNRDVAGAVGRGGLYGDHGAQEDCSYDAYFVP